MHNGRKVVGICTAELEQPFHAKLVQRVMKELTDREHYVLVFSSDSDLYRQSESDEGDASIYDLPNYDIVDVVLIFAMTLRSSKSIMEIVNRAKSSEIPVVSVGMEIDGCYNVVYNMDDAFEKIVRHVVEYHGMREINFMAGIRDDEVSERRLNIFKSVLDDNDILFEEERVGYGGFWEGPTYEVMEEFMHPSKVPPEAIICSNDSMAVAVCDYLAEMDVQVPEEILVTGHDAKKIAELIQELLLGQTVPPHLELGYHMQLSQSCGCQKHHLFDQGRLLRKLNTDRALRVADIRRYADMEGVILKKDSLEEIIDVVADLLPDNSFVCINDDLEVGREVNDHRRQVNPFTRKLNAIVKIDGTVERDTCYLEKMIPEKGKNMAQEMPVIILPLHYEERVVGYLGVWEDDIDKMNMISMIHFLRGLDHSLGYKLSCK